MYMQRLPGGLCFAHGPYETGMQCPRWPACVIDPQKREWLDLSVKQAKRHALLVAAEKLEEESLAPEIVVQLREIAEQFK